MKETKDGRLRQCDLTPFAGAANEGIGHFIAAMDELAERVYDQISDLPNEALTFMPAGSYLSIGRLVIHLANGEAQNVAQITGHDIPADLAAELSGGGRDDLSVPVKSQRTAADLIATCRRVREEMTKPLLGAVTDLDASVEVERGPHTVRQKLMHQVWHWTYHSGHIGLTRLLWGSEYNWRY